MGDRTDVHTVGSKVWVHDDDDSWIKGEVVKVDGDKVTVKTDSGEQRTTTAENCPLQNQDVRGVEDMTRLSYLHEPGVLWNLKVRYGVDDIYTYTGSILIAVNPFAPLPHLYGPHMMEQYCGVNLGELSPHVYAIADAAYRQMRKEGKGQSILVSGESGAGKTETSKLIMKYLAYMGAFVGKNPARQGRSVEEQVLESNPLLEAFGNAKTVRNNNSSRFGKYVEINFHKDGYITGAAIRTYLLERSRVVAINSPERSYHIFYQLCDGATPEERQKWFLKPAREFDYLRKSDCFEIPGVNNAEEYQLTIRAMTRVGISQEDQESIFRTVAAILHLGNVNFVEAGDSDSSKIAPGAPDEHLTACATLLGVDKAGLVKGLTTQTRQTPEGPIVSPISVNAAMNNRDSLAKIIYAKMFDWLVERVNMAIGEDKNCAASVGVLDIYGFESFKFNDLEQFCINLANEKLQQHFNQHVFKMEQAEYEREEIDWSYIEFVDNQDVLDLIEGKMGVLDLLDELCRFPRATPKDFAEKLYASTLCKGSRRFSKPKLSNSAFIIDHYAGAVSYQCDNFLEKNKDFVVAEHQLLLQASEHAFVRDIFPEEAPPPPTSGPPGRSKAGGGTKFNSVGNQFKKQLAELMHQLYQMEPHYVRCIKPNEQNRPTLFQNTMVLQQLRCGGVLEAVRINCAGFPSKRTYADFVDHFWPLSPDVLKSDMDDKEISQKLLSLTPLTGYQLGKTKVFLRAGQMALMDKLRTDKMNGAAATVQRFMRGLLARIYKRRLLHNISLFQSAVRGWAARKEFLFLRQTRAAILIQTAFRRHKTVLEYRNKQATIVRLQALYRGERTRRMYQAMRRQRAAICIQKNWRCHKANKAFMQERWAATTMQNMFRCKRARGSLRFLRSQARESTKLLEDKKMLEMKLKELQATLDVVQNQRNELRQQVKDNLAALTEAQAKARQLEDEMSTQVESIKAQTNAELESERSSNAAMADEIAGLKAALTDARTQSERARIDLQKELNVAQEYIGRLQLEKSESNKQFQSMKEELITRLTNACAQRDEAREQVLNLNQMLEESKANESRLQEQLTAKDVEMQAAITRAASMAPRQGSTLGSMVAAGAVPSGALPTPAPQPDPGTPPPAAAAPTTTPVSPPARTSGSSLPDFPSMANMGPISANVANIMRSRAASLRAPGWLGGMDGPAAGSPALPPTGLPPRTPSQRIHAAGELSDDGTRTPTSETETDRRAREIAAKQQQLVADRRRQDEDKLLQALASNMGFHKGRPVAALTIFRSCIQWRSFQADRTSVFDKIIQVIGSQIEKQQDNNSCLAYWLTNTVTLLHLLQKNIKPASNANSGRGQRVGLSAGGSRSILGQLFRSSSINNAEASIHGGGVGGFRQVEAKYPALLFKQQLDAFVQKIFPMMRDNVKKQITPMLAGCIHTPKGTRTAPRGRGGADASQPQAVVNKHWNEILGLFDELLGTVKDNHVPKVLVQALFRQLFSFVNVQLFNQLLLRRECCSFSNGEYVKTGLALVENWITEVGKEHVGESLDELKYIRQAVQFLVLANKPKKTLEDITRDLCPVLSIQQLYRISTMFWDDKYNTETVSGDVLQRMKQSMVESNSSASHSFLLDDDSTLPFAAQDVLAQMDDKDLYVGVPVPDTLKEGETAGNFSFLEKELRLSSQHSQS